MSAARKDLLGMKRARDAEKTEAVASSQEPPMRARAKTAAVPIGKARLNEDAVNKADAEPNYSTAQAYVLEWNDKATEYLLSLEDEDVLKEAKNASGTYWKIADNVFKQDGLDAGEQQNFLFYVTDEAESAGDGSKRAKKSKQAGWWLCKRFTNDPNSFVWTIGEGAQKRNVDGMTSALMWCGADPTHPDVVHYPYNAAKPIPDTRPETFAAWSIDRMLI